MLSPSRLRAGGRLAGPLIGVALLAQSCGLPPPRLYVLNSMGSPAPGGGTTARNTAESGSSSPQPRGGIAAASRPVLGVAVTVPRYLDRREVVLRSSANEVKVMEGERWADDLAVVTAHALAEDLAALLPSCDVTTLPPRLGRTVDDELRVDFSRFDIDADGNTLLVGQWGLIEGTGGRMRVGGAISRSGHVAEPGFDAMAGALSRDLYAIGSEIAGAMAGLQARSSTTHPP